MTSAIAASYLIDLPAPAPPRFTLVGAAQGVADQDDHWQMGGAVRAYPLSNAVAWTGDPTDGRAVDKKPSPGEGDRSWTVQPFQVVATFQCTRRGIITPDEFRNRALQAFAAYEHPVVEHQFWTGDDADVNMPHLDSDGTAPNTNTLDVLNSGTAVKPLVGLSLLEKAVGDSDVDGMIHMTRAAATSIGIYGFDFNANGATTMLGTPVAIGSGYPGTGKDNGAAAALTEFMFVSGPVQIRRGPIEVFEMLTRDPAPRVEHEQVGDYAASDSNDWVVIIEREYLITWDTALQAAVKIDKAL